MKTPIIEKDGRKKRQVGRESLSTANKLCTMQNALDEFYCMFLNDLISVTSDDKHLGLKGLLEDLFE